MSGKLEGKVALVTGGNSGIGLATAKRFTAEGAHVFITGRRPAELEEAEKAIGGNVTGIQGDVAKLADLDRLFTQIKRDKGKLDVVFANAGIDSGPGFVGGWVGSQRPRVAEGALEHYTDERWNRVIDVNLNGVFATLRAAARLSLIHI